MVSTDRSAAAFWKVIEPQIVDRSLASFEEMIVELAARYGRRKLKDVRESLDRKPDDPKELLSSLTDAIQTRAFLSGQQSILRLIEITGHP